MKPMTWQEFVCTHVVVRVGTDPVRYAVAKDTAALPLVGPLRASKQRAWDAAWRLFDDRPKHGAVLCNPHPANDAMLTLAKLHLKRIAPGAYEHRNLPTATTWRVVQREVPGRATWTFHNAERREGGNDVYYSKAEAAEALVHYLRGRYHDDRYGWTTR